MFLGVFFFFFCYIFIPRLWIYKYTSIILSRAALFCHFCIDIPLYGCTKRSQPCWWTLHCFYSFTLNSEYSWCMCLCIYVNITVRDILDMLLLVKGYVHLNFWWVVLKLPSIQVVPHLLAHQRCLSAFSYVLALVYALHSGFIHFLI